MRIDRKKLLLIGGIVAVVLFAIVATLLLKSDPTAKITDEGDVPASGLVDPENKLLNATTRKDFYAIQDSLQEFGQAKSNNPNLVMTVVDVVAPTGDETTLKIYVDIPELQKKSVEVQVNYAASPDADVHIPEYNFRTLLYGGQD